MAQIKLTSSYVQSGYQRKDSTDIEIFYGEEKPADLENWTLKWHNKITQITIKEQIMPAKEVKTPADDNVREPGKLPIISG